MLSPLQNTLFYKKPLAHGGHGAIACFDLWKCGLLAIRHVHLLFIYCTQFMWLSLKVTHNSDKCPDILWKAAFQKCLSIYTMSYESRYRPPSKKMLLPQHTVRSMRDTSLSCHCNISNKANWPLPKNIHEA